MKCSRFLEVIFFGVFFGQVWGNLGKNPSHPQKFACSYTYAQNTASKSQHLPSTLAKHRFYAKNCFHNEGTRQKDQLVVASGTQ